MYHHLHFVHCTSHESSFGNQWLQSKLIHNYFLNTKCGQVVAHQISAGDEDKNASELQGENDEKYDEKLDRERETRW